MRVAHARMNRLLRARPMFKVIQNDAVPNTERGGKKNERQEHDQHKDFSKNLSRTDFVLRTTLADVECIQSVRLELPVPGHFADILS